MGKQTYKYIIANSIIGNGIDEYTLTRDEYYKLYSFFVTYSMCGKQSSKKRSFQDYGWTDSNIRNTALGNALTNILDLNRNPDFVFTEKDNLAHQFLSHNFPDGALTNVEYERAVLAKTNAPNNYLKLFYRIRDGLAHGKFCLRLSNHGTKMVVIQDDDGHNVTARIAIKLETLINFVSSIDRNNIL